MEVSEQYDFGLGAQAFYYGLSAEKQRLVERCLQNAVPLIESANHSQVYPIRVAGEKVFVLRADEFMRLIVRKAGDTVKLLDIIDKRQAESYLWQAA